MPEPRASEKVVRIAAQMYEMRDFAKRAFGAEYATRCAPWIKIIMAVQRSRRCGVLPALLRLHHDGPPLSGFDVLLSVSAAVEMSETDRILEKLPNA